MRIGDFELRAGERFGCVALARASVDHRLPESIELEPGMWALNRNPFALDDRLVGEWGRLLVDDVNTARLALVAVAPEKGGASEPCANLERTAYHYYRALQLFGVPKVDRAFYVGGSHDGDRPHVSSWKEYVGFRFNENRVRHRIGLEDLQHCRRIASSLREIEDCKAEGRCWRVFYGLHVFFDALRELYMDDRLLQLIRSLDAVLKTPQGGGRREFVRRIGVVVGGGGNTETSLEEMYELRNASAHIHDWGAFLKPRYPRSHKRVAAKRALAAELLAMHVWRRVLESPALVQALADDALIDAFWKQNARALRKAWGTAYPLQKQLRLEFDFHVPDKKG